MLRFALLTTLTTNQAWVLSKGSPESMRPLLDKKGLPSWYDSEYDRLARSGRRVVALAHRPLGPSRAEGGTSAVPTHARCSLHFRAFIINTHAKLVVRCTTLFCFCFGPVFCKTVQGLCTATPTSL